MIPHRNKELLWIRKLETSYSIFIVMNVLTKCDLEIIEVVIIKNNIDLISCDLEIIEVVVIKNTIDLISYYDKTLLNSFQELIGRG